jgi:hypothetical protein
MRLRASLVLAAGVLVVGVLPIQAQEANKPGLPRTQSELHASVMQLYNFHPAKLTDEGRKQKSADLDEFWSSVKANQELELPMLRVELAEDSNPPFFLTDGSQLLLSLSQTKADKQLALDAVAHSDLEDVDNGMYFYLVHELSMEGFDTTKAALHIFDFPGFSVSVPQHAMILQPSDCIMFLLLPVEASSWLPAAQARFADSKNDDEKKALLTLFFYAQTPETDATIHRTAASPESSEIVKKDAQEYEKNEQEALKQHLKQSDIEISLAGTVADIRERRRVRLGAVSDEAMDDVQMLTMRLIQLRHGMK